jgi:RNA polymerase sigma-70 factor (ECF subfamily)
VENETTQLSDEAIAARVQSGDVEAFGLLAERYRLKLIRYGNKILFNQSEVEDTVQEIFLKGYRYIQSFDTGQKFSPWIYRIAHNEFVNLGKKRTRELLDFFDPETFFPHLGLKDMAEEKTVENIREMLGECMDKLDLKYREPLALHYLEGFGYKEVGQILKIPTGTVSIRIARGLARLKVICKQP